MRILVAVPAGAFTGPFHYHHHYAMIVMVVVGNGLSAFRCFHALSGCNLIVEIALFLDGSGFVEVSPATVESCF